MKILQLLVFEPVPIHMSESHQGGLYLHVYPLGLGVDVVFRVDMLHTLDQLVSTQRLEVR